MYTCFKAYDIRGKVGLNFDENIAYNICRAAITELKGQKIVVGFDARSSSGSLAEAVCKAGIDAGCEVLDIGLSGTEEMYWAVTQFRADIGFEITASHNPIEYNGMKIVKHESRPLSDKF